MAYIGTHQYRGADVGYPHQPYQIRMPISDSENSFLMGPLDAVINDIHARYASPESEFPRTNPPSHSKIVQEHREFAKPESARKSRSSATTGLKPAPLFATPSIPKDPVDFAAASGMTMAPTPSGKTGTTRSGGPAQSPASEPSLQEIDQTSQDALEKRRSVCQSPTWEAYAQRKQEKKGAKKEKERAAKQAKAQTTKLTKPPPVQNALRRQTRSEFNVSRSSAIRSDSNDRSASTLELEKSGKYGATKKRSRSRSNSISSLFRIPFESHRRASVDTTTDKGFIGGIKLEGQMQAAKYPDDAEEPCCRPKPEDLGTHPALRSDDSGSGSQKPSEPASQSASRNHYPPIAMQTSSSATTQALVAAEAMPMSDLKGIKRLRASVGLRISGRKSEAETQRANQKEASKPDAAPSRSWRSSSKAPKLSLKESEGHGFMVSESSPVFKNNFGTSYSSAPSSATREAKQEATQTERPGVPTTTRKIQKTHSHSPPSVSRENPGARSSSMDSSFLSGGRNNAQKHIEIMQPSPSDSSMVPQVPLTLLAPPRPIQDNSPYLLDLEELRPPRPFVREQTSSSESSLSEDYHSISSATTPDTSRPQSSKDVFLGPSSHKSHEPRRSSDLRVQAPAHYPASPLEKEISLASAGPYSTGSNSPTFPEHHDDDAPAPEIPPRLRDRAIKKSAQRPQTSPQLASDEQKPSESHESFTVQIRKSKARLRSQRRPLHIDTSHASQTQSHPIDPPSPASSVYGTQDANSWAPHTPNHQVQASPASAADLSPHRPMGKVFVECCGCRYLHDMPSRLYELMSHPEGILSQGGDERGRRMMDYTKNFSTTVTCPWCQHEMSKKCCAGLATIVYVKERLH